jgi:hypothetical protein
MNEYMIPAANIEGLKRDIETLNKRARRNHLPEIVMVVGEPVSKEVEGGTDTLVFFPVAIGGEAPKVGEWQFIATIEHLEMSEDNLVRSVPGQVAEGELNQYRKAAPICEHCGKERRRNNTYILRNEQGEYKQVGHRCLHDFLGYASPDALAKLAEMFFEACETASSACEDDFERAGRPSRLENLENYLAWCSACIRKYGWLSRSQCEYEGGKEPTSITAVIALEDHRAHQREGRPWADVVTPDETDKERTTKALEWVRGLQDLNNDYMYNLHTICRQSFISRRHMGIAASVFAAYNKAMEREQERKQNAALSKYVGTPGERIVRTLTVVSEHSFENSMGGTTHLYTLFDQEGNQFKWFASNKVLKPENTYRLKFTVKKHEEDRYKGFKQTIITRAKEEPPQNKRQSANNQ